MLGRNQSATSGPNVLRQTARYKIRDSKTKCHVLLAAKAVVIVLGHPRKVSAASLRAKHWLGRPNIVLQAQRRLVCRGGVYRGFRALLVGLEETKLDDGLLPPSRLTLL